MTPLYHRLVKRLTLPERKREPLRDPHGLLDDLSDVHCFDCAGIQDLAQSLATRGEWRELSPELFCLSGPRSWIEFEFGEIRVCRFVRNEQFSQPRLAAPPLDKTSSGVSHPDA